MGNDSFGGQNQVERLADPDPHMILQAGDLVSKDLFRSLSLIPYVKKGDSHTFGEEAGRGRPQWQTKKDLGMPGLGPRSPGYTNSLILRASELGMKGKELRVGWSRKGGLQLVTRSQNHDDVSFPIYVTGGQLHYRARGVPKGAWLS